jgi:crossover junction endodeoxyribonuclease RusA
VEAVTRVYELPYPPSVNHYWRHVGRRTLISREGRRYRERVCGLLLSRCEPPMRGRLQVSIVVFQPNRRAIDLDNRLKGLLDSLEHAGVYENDSQIDRLVIERGAVVPGGKVVVRIEEQTCNRTATPS